MPATLSVPVAALAARLRRTGERRLRPRLGRDVRVGEEAGMGSGHAGEMGRAGRRHRLPGFPHRVPRTRKESPYAEYAVAILGGEGGEGGEDFRRWARPGAVQVRRLESSSPLRCAPMGPTS
jgi:hypothetical protein